MHLFSLRLYFIAIVFFGVIPLHTHAQSNPQSVTQEELQPIEDKPLAPSSVAQVEIPNDLWERIRRGFGMPDLQVELVQDREQWYAQRPDYIQRMTERSSKYLFHIVEELERRGMPTELALLPFI